MNQFPGASVSCIVSLPAALLATTGDEGIPAAIKRTVAVSKATAE
jgi:hypothetical protein